MPVAAGATMTQSAVAVYQAIPAQTPALPTSLWFGQVPETNPQLPIAQFIHQGEAPVPQGYPTASTKPVMLEGRFAIKLYATTIPNVEAMAASLMTAFTPDSIAIQGTGNCVTKRTNYVLEIDALRSAPGAPVWTAQISWLVQIGEPQY